MNRILPIALALGLAGCATTTQQAKTDADLIALGVQLFAPALIKAVPSQAQTITDATAAIVAADQALGGTLNTSSPVMSVKTIAADVEVLAPIAIKYLPVGSVEAMAANAAVALLPSVLSAAGVSGAAGTAPVAMSPDAARMILRGVR